MIIDKNTNPERDLYYMGGFLIEILLKNGNEEVDYLDLYSLVKDQKDITFNLYSLTLDWLYILGVITNGETGKIKTCF